MRRYCELKGIPVWPVGRATSSLWGFTYWIVPPHKRIAPLDGADWHASTHEERLAYNEKRAEQTIDDSDFVRHDLALVHVVEELGEAASGMFAKLAIFELPDGASYRIDEYDGYESVMTPDDYDWTIAA